MGIKHDDKSTRLHFIQLGDPLGFDEVMANYKVAAVALLESPEPEDQCALSSFRGGGLLDEAALIFGKGSPLDLEDRPVDSPLLVCRRGKFPSTLYS